MRAETTATKAAAQHRGYEQGSITVVTAGILAVVGTLTFAVVKLGVAANERARAQAIADLGSLAGASSDLETAKVVVANNGALVLEATESGDGVDLAVSFGEAQAQARAERRYVAWNPIDYGPGATEDLETTTVPTTAAPTTTRALIFATIASTPTPTTRALVFPTIPPVTTKKPVATVPPKAAPTPGTSPRRR
jgi:uncharacterized membrane protein